MTNKPRQEPAFPNGRMVLGKYLITQSGEVYSTRFVNNRTNKERFKRLKSNPDRAGYLRVCLCADSVKVSKMLHVLVLETFVCPRPVGMYACHKDGNKLNNKLENLYWGTPKENMLDRSRHGRAPIGSANKVSKLVEEEVLEIRKRSARGEKQVMLAREFGVSRDSIRKIVRGDSWKHVPLAELSRAEEGGKE